MSGAQWVGLNPDKLTCTVIFTAGGGADFDRFAEE